MLVQLDVMEFIENTIPMVMDNGFRHEIQNDVITISITIAIAITPHAFPLQSRCSRSTGMAHKCFPDIRAMDIRGSKTVMVPY